MPEPTALPDLFRLPAPALRADLACVRQPWVRDIAWLLHAPDMVELEYPGRPALSALGLDDDRRRRDWLMAQEALNGQFRQHLERRRAHRLGLYHEVLWQWILEHAPLTRLLAHNLVLREGLQTLGELDLLYAERTSHVAPHRPRIHHAELAIKFFLGLPEGPGDARDAARWIGIGSFDSLAIKTHRLSTRQLPMGRSLPARRMADTLLPGAELHQCGIMPGVLYHPWRQRLPLPRVASANVLQGLWCHLRQWPALASALPFDSVAQRLVKPHWLAPQATAALSLPAFGQTLKAHFARYGSPVHLRLSLPDGRGCRLFVVRDEWPPMLPLPPRAPSPSAH